MSRASNLERKQDNPLRASLTSERTPQYLPNLTPYDQYSCLFTCTSYDLTYLRSSGSLVCLLSPLPGPSLLGCSSTRNHLLPPPPGMSYYPPYSGPPGYPPQPYNNNPYPQPYQ